jgi:hypothetical protein
MALSHQYGRGFDHSHLIDWRLIRRLSANVLNSFCKQECAELVEFGTGCRSTARIEMAIIGP